MTPRGILVIRDDAVITTEFLAEVDVKTDDLEACLGRQINLGEIHRNWFVVYVPVDWYVSTCSGEQLIPSTPPPSSCRSKGLVIPVECEYVERPTPECPCVCNVRAVIQDSRYIVVTPNLKLYRAELTRLVTNVNNPWTNQALLPCL